MWTNTLLNTPKLWRKGCLDYKYKNENELEDDKLLRIIDSCINSLDIFLQK